MIKFCNVKRCYGDTEQRWLSRVLLFSWLVVRGVILDYTLPQTLPFKSIYRSTIVQYTCTQYIQEYHSTVHQYTVYTGVPQYNTPVHSIYRSTIVQYTSTQYIQEYHSTVYQYTVYTGVPLYTTQVHNITGAPQHSTSVKSPQKI